MDRIKLSDADFDAFDSQQDEQRVRAAGIAAPAGGPDQIGRALQIADKRGLPGVVILDNLPDYEVQEHTDAVVQTAKADPVLGNWLADPVNNGLAKDDYGSLLGVSKAADPWWKRSIADDLRAPKSKLDVARTLVRQEQYAAEKARKWKEEVAKNPAGAMDFMRAFVGSVTRGVGSGVRGVGGAWEVAYNKIVGNPVSFLTGTDQTAGNIFGGAADAISGLGDDVSDGASAGFRQMRADNEIAGEVFSPSTWSMGKDPSFAGFMANGIDVLGSLAPVIVATVLSGGSTVVGAAVGGSMGGGAGMEQATAAIDRMQRDGTLEEQSSVYRELVQSGVGPAEALAITKRRAEEWALTLTAPISMLGGAATTKILNPASKVLVGQRVGVQAVGRGALGAVEEAAQEVSEGVASQTGINVGAGADLNVGEGSFGNAVLGAFGGAVPGTIAGTAAGLQDESVAANAMRRSLDKWTRASVAESDKASLDALMKQAAENKTRTRSASKFEALVKGKVGDAKVYVPTASLEMLFQDGAAAQVEALTGSSVAWDEALAAGTPVQIDMAAYVTRMAEFHDQIGADVRVSPDLDAQEPPVRLTDAQIQEDIAAALTEGAIVDDEAARSGTVFNDFYGQLLGAGVEETTAAHQALAAQSVFRTWESRLGMEPDTLANRYQFNINRPQQAAPATIELVPDSAFNADSASGLADGFYSESFDPETGVLPLANSGFRPDEIASLEAAGLATNGAMNYKQFGEYNKERDLRNAGGRKKKKPAGAPRNVDAALDPAIEQVRKQRASGKDSSMEFPADNLASRIIAMGGINPQSVGAGDLRKVGRVGLLNNSGMTVEAAAEALANDGLGDLFTTRDEFGRPDYRELLEMLSDEAQGLRTFTDPSRSVSAEAAVENQARVDTVAGIISKLEGQGVAVDDLSVPELRALIEPMLNEDDVSGETGPSGMFYQDALPDTPTYEQLVAELARVNNLLRVDQLTGMRNRFAFEEDANLGWSTISVIDLDGLKNLNDSLGLKAGDALLKAAGSVMLAAETDGVRFYRQGGDEYAVRIRDADVAGPLLQEVIDRLESADVTITSKGVDYLYQGIGAGYGIGQTFEEANENEKADKQRRTEAGIRERRGADGTPGRVRQIPGREGTGRRDGEGAQPEAVDQTATPSFEAWSQGATVVTPDMLWTSEYEGGPAVFELFHGTTADFDTFDRSKASVEADMGAGFYFSSEPGDVGSNYAGLGPDLTSKIQREAERIAGDTDRQWDDPEVVAEARAKWVQNEGSTMKVFVRTLAPAIVGGPNETMLTYEESYDEETDEYGEPGGTLLAITEAIQEVESNFDGINAEALVGEVMEAAMDRGGLGMSDLVTLLKESENAVYAVDNEIGDMAVGEFIRQVFEAAGYDAIVDYTVDQKFGSQRPSGTQMQGMNDETVHVIAFEPTQIKSATGNSGAFDPENPNILFQSDTPLVSALAQSVDAAKGAPKKGDATAWKGWLDGAQRRGEFKQAERDWMGVDAWLDSAGEVTREQLQEFVRANQLQIEEVTLGGDPQGVLSESGYYVSGTGNNATLMDSDTDVEANMAAAPVEVLDAFAAIAEGRDGGGSKFASYQLPGGENYRELLLTLPAQSATDGGYGDWQQHAASMGFMQEAIDEVWNDPDRESDLEFEAWRQGQTDGPAAAQYRSSHFDQPNILAHVRFNERTDADGKRVLFLEEVQSDWHQAGRKQGYGGQITADKPMKAVLWDNGIVWEVSTESGEFVSNVTPSDVNGGAAGSTITAEQAIAEVRRRLRESPQQTANAHTVPDAPFKTTWPMLAMKRMLRYAAENGFDRIAWTTGEQQAARYDLSKQVNEVTVGFRGDERMVMIEAGGNTMERAVVNVDGVITESKRGYEGKGLDEVIGKEMADKIMGLSAPANLKGDDLKIGGEGMRAFYDKMLPAEVNKLGKKFGAKVGTTKLANEAGTRERNDDLALLAELEQDVGTATPTQGGESVHSLDITPALREAALEGLPLFQGGTAPRGGILGGDGRSIIGDKPGPDGRRVFNISLFAGMNYSTFLHENAHAFLEIFGDLAEAEGAPQQVKDDWSKALKFMGVENRGQIGRDQHELWARAGEAYLREGRAPSPSLRRSFANFKVWLTGIYRTAMSLRVELTDEVRGVFDRMYATDAEIAEAKQQQGLGAMFRHGETIGMTPEEEVAYWNAVDAAQADAESALAAEVLTAQQRAAKAFLSAERRKVQAQVEAATRALRPYKSIRWLRQGLLPDGSPVPTPIKLSRQALLDAGYLPAFIQRHLSGMYSKNGGMSLETAAELLGYGGGAEMVQEIVDAPALQEVIKADTARIMAERYPDPLVDGTLVDRAMEAVHREKQGEAMLLGVQALERHVDGRVRSQAHVLMEVAKRLIASKRARDLQPNTYRLAEAKNGRLALAAAARQDWPAAASAARQQLLAHHLYNEARRARAEVDAAQKFLRKQGETNARQKLGKAGNYLTRDGSYLEQVDGILERYDLKPMSGAAADRRASLASWIQSQEEAGYDVAIPESVRNEAQRTPFRELTVEQVREVRDAVKHIVAMARLRNKLLLAQDGRTLEDNVADLVATAEANHTVLPEAMDLSPSFSRKFGDWLSKIDATLLKPEFLFTWLDGEKANGQFWRKLFQPFVDAEADEVKRMGVVSTELRRLFKDYQRGKLSTQRLSIPASKTRKFAGNFTRESLLVVGLNMGNDYNRQAMMDGFGWTDAQLQAVAAHLTDADWDTVAGVWKLYESVRPDAFALEKAMTGLEPDLVEAAPFMTPNGRMLAGGYHPIKFDSEFSYTAFKRDAKQAVQDAYGGNFSKPMTKKGHLKARTNTGGQPIKLSLSVVSEHLTNVIHDVTHRRALFDVQRLLDHPDVRGVIEATAGRNAYRVLNPWLQRIGADPAMDVNPLEAMFRRARVGATVVNMGFKITTAMTQLTGYTQSIEVMGAGAMAVGFREFGKNPRQALRFAMDRSQVLPHRMQSYDRDVRDSLSRITSGGLRDDVQRSFFFLTGMVDMGVVVPTWLGAYHKAIGGDQPGVDAGNEVDAISYADGVVRQSQSSGSTKDLAMVQRGNEAFRMFTMFYSYFSVLYNLGRRSIKRTKSTKDLPRLAASTFYLWFVPYVLAELLAGRGPEDDEEWGDWWVSHVLPGLATYPIQTIPVVRDIVNGAVGDFGYSPSPAFDAFESAVGSVKTVVVKGGKIAISKVTGNETDEEIKRRDIKQLVMTAGYWGKLPSRQAWITGSYLYDLAVGNEQPENIGDVFNGIAFSRPEPKE